MERLRDDVTVLTDSRDINDVVRCARTDSVAYVLALAHLEEAQRTGVMPGEVWGYTHEGAVIAALWVGANCIPLVPQRLTDPRVRRDIIAAFAHRARRTGRRSSSLVGPARDVLALWEALDGAWSAPREIRPSQPSMVWAQSDQLHADPRVRLARLSDFDALLPASVHMFVEEVGVSPLRYGSVHYSRRVRELIAESRTYVMLARDVYSTLTGAEGNRVVFKADVGSMCADVAQIQGVWIDPGYRGRGLSASAMVSVARDVTSRLGLTVSLYVNDYNHRAIRAYRRAGFTEVGTYATVMF